MGMKKKKFFLKSPDSEIRPNSLHFCKTKKSHFYSWINWQVCIRVFQFCVSDVGTLSTLINPASASSTAEPAAGTSGKSGDAESAPADKTGTVMVA